MNDFLPKRAMVIMAHPDDIEFFVGGTVALWTAAGCEVIFVLTTSGDAGGGDASMARSQVAMLRQQEQRAAARMLGVEQVVFLDAPDGEVMPTLELRTRIVAEIRRFRPDTVMVFDPTSYYFFEHGYLNHPDHRATGEAALAAISPAARNPMYRPELLADGLAPHVVEQVWLAIPPWPDHWVEVTSVFDRKLAAMRCHTSQISDHARLEASLRRVTESLDPSGNVVHREGFRRLMIG